MALVNKLKQSEVVQQSAQPQSSSNVTETKTQAAKPIDMKVDKPADESKKNSEILDYLNSDKFKALSQEDQLKAFKEKYGLGLSDEELTKMFTNAKKVAAEFSQRTALETGEETQTAVVASSNDTVKAEVDAKKDIIENLKQQGIENPTQGDLYNYLTTLKANGEELTAEQAKMLKTFNALLDSGFQGLKTSNSETSKQQQVQKTDDNAGLLPVTLVLNKSFLYKKSSEKLNIYMDSYLTKNDPNYATLDDKEKQKYCTDKSRELVKSLGVKDFKKLDHGSTLSAIAILEDYNRKGEKLDFSDKNLVQRVSVARSNYMKNGLNEILSRDEFKNKSPQEQLMAIGNILYANEDDFVNLSDADKAKYIDDNIQNVFESMGLPVKLLGATSAEKSEALTRLSILINDFAKQPEDITISKYMAMIQDPEESTRIFLRSLGEQTENSELYKYYIQKQGVIEDLKNRGIENPTNADIVEYLKNKKEPLTEHDKIMLKECMALVGYGLGKKSVSNYFGSVITAKITNGRPTDEIINDGLKKYKDNPELLSQYMTAIVMADPERYEEVVAKLKQQYSPKEFDKLFGDLQAYAASKAMATDKPETVDKILRVEPNNKHVATTYRISGRIMQREANAKLIAASMDHTILREKSAEALNDRNYYTKEQAVDVFKEINSKGLASDSNFSSYSKLFIETAKNNGAEDQLYLAKGLTDIGNAAVTEGVAAAGNSIPPSSRSQFNNIISDAVSSGNYSSNEVANINNALQTGRISNETLAKTTPPSATATNPAANAPAKSAPAPSNTGNVPAQKAVGNQAVAQSGGVQTPVQPVSVEPKLQAAQIRNDSVVSSVKSNSSVSRQEAMQNAAETKSSIDKSVKDWEDKHNAKLSNEDINALKTSAAASVIGDIIGDDNASLTSKEAVAQILQNASNINELYSTLVSLYGSKVQNKFVESLASFGSAAQIHSFAENSGNKDVIKDLYMRCGSSGLKNELLGLLPPSSVYEMLSARQIHDLSSVDYKVLKEYVIKNLSHMSNTEFNNYLKFLPFDERQALVKLRANDTPLTGNEVGEIGAYAKNLKTENDTANTVLPGSDEWAEQNRARQSGVKVPPSSVYATYTADDALSDWDGFGSSKVPFGRNYDKQKRSHVYWG